jgi:hypothetical protein
MGHWELKNLNRVISHIPIQSEVLEGRDLSHIMHKSGLKLRHKARQETDSYPVILLLLREKYHINLLTLWPKLKADCVLKIEFEV